MKETLGLESYTSHVVEGRFLAKKTHNWQSESAVLLNGELVEMLIQHGVGALLLLPEEFGDREAYGTQELRHGMLDEMGDVTWFCFDVAESLGINVSEACQKALKSHVPEFSGKIHNFSDLEAAVMDNADKIRILNKMGMYLPKASDDIRYTTLAIHPQYLLLRTGTRLTRALEGGQRSGGPPTASDLEPVSDLEHTIGDYLLVLTYIAKARLGASMEDVAQFNIAKLSHRAVHGKANDIHFTDWYQQQGND